MNLSIDEYIARQSEYDKWRGASCTRSCGRLCRPSARWKYPGLENVPRQGRTCLMINHVSYLDPIVVTVSIPFRLY